MVEGARLESVYRGDSIVGSNPTVSAKKRPPLGGGFFVAVGARPRIRRVRSRSKAQATAPLALWAVNPTVSAIYSLPTSDIVLGPLHELRISLPNGSDGHVVARTLLVQFDRGKIGLVKRHCPSHCGQQATKFPNVIGFGRHQKAFFGGTADYTDLQRQFASQVYEVMPPLIVGPVRNRDKLRLDSSQFRNRVGQFM